MSTLKVDNLLNTAGNESPISVPGAAKAWLNFNGVGTVAIRDSFNVSSVTDNGTGDFTVNFTSAMANANYCFQLSATDDGTEGNQTDGFVYGGWKEVLILLVFQLLHARFYWLSYESTLYDESHTMVTVFAS